MARRFKTKAQFDAGLSLPAGAASGSVLVSDASGNASWQIGGGAPTGAAGGDLAGSTYPNPVIAPNAITSAKIADGTITDNDVAGNNKDGANGVFGMRSLGNAGGQAMPGSWRLNDIASQSPNNGPVGFNNQRITNLADPTGAQDAATKQYTDAAVKPKIALMLALGG